MKELHETFSDRDAILARAVEKRVGSAVSEKRPKVSVVIPAFNVADFIGDALRSVFAQGYSDFEVIVVNDGSDDDADFDAAIAPYLDRIVYAKQENAGAGAARNLAICLSRGDFIAFLDGDDVWLPAYLESQMAFIEGSGAGMVYCDASIIDDPRIEGKTYFDLNQADSAVSPECIIRFGCIPVLSGTIARRELLENFGLFDTEIRRGQDFDLCLRFALRGAEIRYQRKVLLHYRFRLGGLTGSDIQSAKRTISILEAVEAKYEFRPSERAALDRSFREAKSRLALDLGKSYLVSGNFSEAKRHFRDANRLAPSTKNLLIILGLYLSPGLISRTFKSLRPSEVELIEDHAAQLND